MISRFLGLIYHDLARFQSGKITIIGLLKRGFSPRYMPVLIYRLSYFFYECHIPIIPKLLSFCNFVIFGIEIAHACKIDGGLYLPHTQGTVIGAFTIGKNATIFQGVTIGASEVDLDYNELKRPTLGNNVTVGAGAKIVGYLHVGDFTKIAPNSVVVTSTAPYSTMGGIPAKALFVNP